jgi:predicted protein tyrosine phosphatase
VWVWTLNWGEIRDGLVVGSCPITPTDIDRIHNCTGATALLSLQTDACRAALDIDYEAHKRHGERRRLTLVNTPLRDFDPPHQRRHLPGAVRALFRLLDDGHQVYVHCTAGINRSPLTVLAYLSFVETMEPEEAMALIRDGRPEAEPYWESYHGCRRDLLAQYRRAVELRAWELSQRKPDNPPEINWEQAEKEVLRQLLTVSH